MSKSHPQHRFEFLVVAFDMDLHSAITEAVAAESWLEAARLVMSKHKAGQLVGVVPTRDLRGHPVEVVGTWESMPLDEPKATRDTRIGPKAVYTLFYWDDADGTAGGHVFQGPDVDGGWVHVVYDWLSRFTDPTHDPHRARRFVAIVRGALHFGEAATDDWSWQGYMRVVKAAEQRARSRRPAATV